MSPANKTKAPSAPTWCILTPSLFSLNADEVAVIEKHRKTWEAFASAGIAWHGDAVDVEWSDAVNGAAHGDTAALELVEKFGSAGHLQRFREISERGRTARFQREHVGNLRECHPMLLRARERVEALLADYEPVLRHQTRLALGIRPGTSDEVTTRLEGLITRLNHLLAWEPVYFELLPNHLPELTEIETEDN
jgi:hypothetical protein